MSADGVKKGVNEEPIDGSAERRRIGPEQVRRPERSVDEILSHPLFMQSLPGPEEVLAESDAAVLDMLSSLAYDGDPEGLSSLQALEKPLMRDRCGGGVPDPRERSVQATEP